MLNICENQNLFRFPWSDEQLKFKPKILHKILQSLHFIHFCAWRLISKCGHNLKEMFSFDDIVHLIDEENFVICVDLNCGFAFYIEAPKKPKKN